MAGHWWRHASNGAARSHRGIAISAGGGIPKRSRTIYPRSRRKCGRILIAIVALASRKAGCVMATHITVDPITRIEGHLRIDVEIDGGVVKKARASGQTFGGIERILVGRDPREAWLFTQRFCSLCTMVQVITSMRAVENALRLEIPPNAQYIRNLIVAAHAMHDHIVHFYKLSALD
jgi:hypothetical protein